MSTVEPLQPIGLTTVSRTVASLAVGVVHTLGAPWWARPGCGPRGATPGRRSAPTGPGPSSGPRWTAWCAELAAARAAARDRQRSADRRVLAPVQRVPRLGGVPAGRPGRASPGRPARRRPRPPLVAGAHRRPAPPRQRRQSARPPWRARPPSRQSPATPGDRAVERRDQAVAAAGRHGRADHAQQPARAAAAPAPGGEQRPPPPASPTRASAGSQGSRPAPVRASRTGGSGAGRAVSSTAQVRVDAHSARPAPATQSSTATQRRAARAGPRAAARVGGRRRPARRRHRAGRRVSAAAIAASTAAALFRVSWSSVAGSESATIPAPACT